MNIVLFGLCQYKTLNIFVDYWAKDVYLPKDFHIYIFHKLYLWWMKYLHMF